MDYLKDQKKSYEDAIKVVRIKMMFQLAAVLPLRRCRGIDRLAFKQISSFMACLEVQQV